MEAHANGGSEHGDVTQLLGEVSNQSPGAVNRLFNRVYDELRRLAEIRLAHYPPWRTVDPTALVNEFFVRIFGRTSPSWETRSHFYNSASLAMKRILADRAKQMCTEKRGGRHHRVALSDDLQGPTQDIDFLALSEILDDLEGRWPQRGLLVRLRFFAGLAEPQIADAMRVSPATVRRLWPPTKAWIRYRLGAETAG